MRRWSRRSFLASAAALAAAPALAAPRPTQAPEVPRSGWVDAVIVGAGAAGIAAARRLAAARQALCRWSRRPRRSAAAASPTRRRSACLTIAAPTGSTPPTSIRWRSSASQAGLEIYPAPPGQRVRIGRRYAREGEMEDFLAGLVRANAAIADAARKSDVACAQVLPKDLGEWRPTIEFVLGPYSCGKDLAEVSTVDFVPLGRARQRRVLPAGIRTRCWRSSRPDFRCCWRRR